MKLISLLISLFSIIKTKALECVSVVNQECIARAKITDVNKNELVFYPLSIKINKCSGNCNNINDPMVKLCVPDIIKNMNIKVFNMLSRINETRKLTWHETCKCICRFTKAVCNDKQEWNENKCRCESKEDLIDKLICDKGYIWNPSTCTCECNKYCGTGQYLDYKNCLCRKKIIDYLIEQCSSIIDMENKNNTINNTIYNNNNNNNNVYFILFVIFLIICLIICVLLIVGLIYYYRGDSNKKILDRMYNIVYSRNP